MLANCLIGQTNPRYFIQVYQGNMNQNHLKIFICMIVTSETSGAMANQNARKRTIEF